MQGWESLPVLGCIPVDVIAIIMESERFRSG